MDKNELATWSIDELNEERKRNLDAINEAREIIKSFNDNIQILDEEILQRKQPGAGQSKKNRINQFATAINAVISTVKTEEPVPSSPKQKKVYYRPNISDHAVLRYIQRVFGFDIEKVRSDILSKEIASALELGATRVTVNGIEMIAREGNIVTVLNKESMNG